jgi:hypothetical protein
MLNGMNNGPIPAGTKSSLTGMRPKLKSSEESKFLYLIIQELRNLGGVITNSAMGPTVASFTVDAGGGAPISGANTWVIGTLNVIHKSPTFTLNGVIQVEGTDYTFDNTLGKIFLLSTTFVASDVWTVIY